MEANSTAAQFDTSNFVNQEKTNKQENSIPCLDRRVFSRFLPSSQVTARWGDFKDGNFGGKIVDWSKGGFRFIGKTKQPMGSYARVFLSVHGQRKEIELVTRLVWRRAVKGVSKNNYTIGVMVLKRKGYEDFIDLINNSTETLSAPKGRRQGQRRIQSGEIHVNKRLGEDRRVLPGISRRLFSSGISLDRWVSRYTYERELRSASASIVELESGKKLMLGANNYLGLTDHPKVKAAAIRAIEKYGTGAGGVRVLSGTMDLHKELEEKLAHFKHAESCLVFPSGYVANLATITAIAENGDVLLNDEVNHASIVDGCRASKGTLRFYRHNDLENLEKKLSRYPRSTPKLVITDGVFSMDGDVAPIDGILEISRRYNAMLMVDDAHATGVVGPTGRGSAEHCGVLGKVDITTVTLSKALGAVGGAICGSRSLIKRIFNLSRAFIFTSALPPSVCASVIAALEVIEEEKDLVSNLARNREILCSGLREMGFKVPATQSAVIPVIIGDEVKTYQLAARLDDLGVFVNAVSRPAVPREYSRLRLSVMATHTEEQLNQALLAFNQAGKELGLIN